MFVDRSMDKDVVRIHNGILLSHRKNEIVPCVAAWTDLEIIKPNEVTQRKANAI